MTTSTGPIIWAVVWVSIWSCMIIWPKWFYEHSKLRGQLSNGPVFTRIVGIVMISLPIAGFALVKFLE